jgi:glycosyltransferase involved in cell wall biosynthesis
VRIVIDMQGAQSESRFRGIGRYTLSFVQAVARNRGEHELILALNGAFPESIASIRAAIDGFLSPESIRVWNVPAPVCAIQAENDSRVWVAERMREAFLESLEPDIIHISSLFEGYGDDAITSIGEFDRTTPVSVVLYDLIPLLNPATYLDRNPRFAEYYRKKIAYLNRASCYLAISAFSRNEGIAALSLPPDCVTNIAAAVDPEFRPLKPDVTATEALRAKFGIRASFVLYTGGCDTRKNLPGLIRAYAALPETLRTTHQLVLAGKMPEGNIEQLRAEARAAGLHEAELVFTNYVSDAELLRLYNDCALFVFPSWHEGFGLPALEAMSCGAPVIAANTSSLPEVIGDVTGMFDPHDSAAMTAKLCDALSSPALREALRRHGLEQARHFSWDITARRALDAWENCLKVRNARNSGPSFREVFRRADLIDVLGKQIGDWPEPAVRDLADKLAQNEASGISRQLFLDVSELSQRDAATGVQRVVRGYLMALLASPPAGYRIEPVYATSTEGYRYARGFTARILGEETPQIEDEVIGWQRGDIFFGLDMQHHVQLKHANFYQQLRADGVTVQFLVHDLLPIQFPKFFSSSGQDALHKQLLSMIARTDGAICVSQATAVAYREWLDEEQVTVDPAFTLDWNHSGGDIANSLPSHGMPEEATTVLTALRSRPSLLCVSTLEPRKCQQQILDAVESLWASGEDINLVLVGQAGWKTEALVTEIERHAESGKRLFWLRGISDEYLSQVYALSACLVAASLNEGFGLSLVEAAQHGLPIVARDIPVFREIAGDHAYYFKGERSEHMASALQQWLALYRAGNHPKSRGIRWLTWRESTEQLKALLLGMQRSRQLLVDISELVQRDARTGIQRVVRSVLGEWLKSPPQGYRVEPVYALPHEPGYRYARRFAAEFLSRPEVEAFDAPICYAPGDVFFGLDFQPVVVPAQRFFLEKLRYHGVKTSFMLYDMLSVQMPENFPAGTDEGFSQWLGVIAQADEVVAISKSVARDFEAWIKQSQSGWRPRIGWAHIGADIQNSTPSRGMPTEAADVLNRMRERPSLLMVGTIEPRKGHRAVIDACESLWRRGVEFNLVMVGKQGWMSNELADRLRGHSEFARRLYWLESISDEYLEQVYAASACLIAASEGEGFGLPLIEAAQHELPILARDLPVFREVAAGHATFFPLAATNELLARAIEDWLVNYERGECVRSGGMPRLSWEESARNLLALLLRQGELLVEHAGWLSRDAPRGQCLRAAHVSRAVK